MPCNQLHALRFLIMVGSLLVGGASWAAGPAAPADPLAWRVAPGIAAPALGAQPPRRRMWCDLGQHVAATQPAPFALDPVFHRPPEPLRARMAVALKKVELARPGTAAAQQASAEVTLLLRGKEGPALARMALMYPGPRGRLAAIRGAQPLVERHPRLVGFIADDLHAKEPARARAAVAFALGARCDTPAIYAMDGLEHADPSVREAVLRGALRTAERLDDKGIMMIVATHVTTRERLPRLRALYARGVGLAGWAPGTESIERLLKDKSPMVRAEARVALARLQKAPAPAAWAKERSAAGRIWAIRAYAAARTDARVVATLTRWRTDHRRVRDPLGAGPTLQVGAAAAAALAWHGVRSEPRSTAPATRSGASR